MPPVTDLQIGIHVSCKKSPSGECLHLPVKLVLTGTVDSITLDGKELLVGQVHENTRYEARVDGGLYGEDGNPEKYDENAENLSRLEIELLSISPGKIESRLRSAVYKIRFLPAPLQEKARRIVENVHQECQKRRTIISSIEKLVKEAYQNGSEDMLEAAWVQLVSAMENWPASWKRYGFDAFEEACEIGYDAMMLRLEEDPVV